MSLVSRDTEPTYFNDDESVDSSQFFPSDDPTQGATNQTKKPKGKKQDTNRRLARKKRLLINSEHCSESDEQEEDYMEELIDSVNISEEPISQNTSEEINNYPNLPAVDSDLTREPPEGSESVTSSCNIPEEREHREKHGGEKTHADDSGFTEHAAEEPCDSESSGPIRRAVPIVAAVAAGATAVVLAPVAIAAIGFGTGGIAAGSLAASMMSTAATSGVGMAAVSALQSAGAAGLALSTQVGIGSVGAVVGHRFSSLFMRGKKEEQEEKRTTEQ